MSDDVVYRLDADDHIYPQGPGWNWFADSNGAPEIFSEEISGKSLWIYVRDDNVAEVYRIVFSQVRADGEAVRFPYRCDSPVSKRFMSMTVEAMDDGGLLITNALEHEEPLPTTFHFEERQVPGQTALLRCSLCNSVRFQGQWSDISEAIADGLEAGGDRQVVVAHTVCTACHEQIKRACKHVEST
jgi:hypothetical protein